MRYTTYTKYVAGLAEQVNLQALLDQLGDFLLESGFAGTPWWGEPGDDEGERSLDDLRNAILKALIESGQLTPDMLKLLKDGTTGDAEKDKEVQEELATLLDRIVQRLAEEGYLNLSNEAGQTIPPDQLPGGEARAAARTVKFDLKEKGADFLGYRTLRALLGALGRSAIGAHETPHLATSVESESASKVYEFGDVMNLDAAATLTSAIARHGLKMPLELDYADLHVTQADYRSSAATVLMLDCSHSMVLYGEDRFTPAKKVALALTHLIRHQFPGDVIKVVLFHDTAEEIPPGALASVKVGPYHTNTAAGLQLARRILAGQRQEMKQIVMITDGKPSAMTLPDGRVYVNSGGLDPSILKATYAEVSACRRSNIMINTFMLARDPYLVEFVKQVSRICRGKAYFASPMTLGQFLLMDFLKGKTRRVG
ncbi:MAG TPA: VWA domain-containing protein [Gemmatimonadales bacterium]|nr:VWA domain-containing protein [Gemmatimonadales bacterium]